MSPPKKSIVERLALDEPAQAVAIGAPHIEAIALHRIYSVDGGAELACARRAA